MIIPVNSDKAPKVVGRYRHAINIGDLVFCSGQIGVDPTSGDLKKSFEDQADQAIANLKSVLLTAASNLQYVLKTTVFLTDMAHYDAMNKVYSRHFGTHAPARSAVCVAALPKGALFEIEAVAVQPIDSDGCACGGNCGCGGH